jgi:hypothetical protein
MAYSKFSLLTVIGTGLFQVFRACFVPKRTLHRIFATVFRSVFGDFSGRPGGTKTGRALKRLRIIPAPDAQVTVF